jgi:predicted nucleic acid-binding protein
LLSRSIAKPMAPSKRKRDSACGRDEDDWPVLATALALACAIWSEDTDFFGTGVAVWTTNRIEIFLKAQTKSSATDVE